MLDAIMAGGGMSSSSGALSGRHNRDMEVVVFQATSSSNRGSLHSSLAYLPMPPTSQPQHLSPSGFALDRTLNPCENNLSKPHNFAIVRAPCYHFKRTGKSTAPVAHVQPTRVLPRPRMEWRHRADLLASLGFNLA